MKTRYVSRNWTAKTPLAKAVWNAGFCYAQPSPKDAKNEDAVKGGDFIFSRPPNGWPLQPLQYLLGYGRVYDEAAPFAGMCIDCEPLYFTWGNRDWLVELWKGQYGLETGCEIGVYSRAPNAAPKECGLYDCVVNPNDLKKLSMFYEFYHEERHEWKLKWTRTDGGYSWLTSFRWGLYSGPDDVRNFKTMTSLRMLAIIRHPFYKELANALGAAGYTYVQAIQWPHSADPKKQPKFPSADPTNRNFKKELRPGCYAYSDEAEEVAIYFGTPKLTPQPGRLAIKQKTLEACKQLVKEYKEAQDGNLNDPNKVKPLKKKEIIELVSECRQAMRWPFAAIRETLGS